MRATMRMRRAGCIRNWQKHFEENETYFEPKKLTYKVRKDAPATKIQKVYLNDLMKYHKIETNVALDLLTRSQASRLTLPSSIWPIAASAAGSSRLSETG